MVPEGAAQLHYLLKCRVDIGAMDHGVAVNAGLQLRRSCVHPVNRAGSNWAVALVAQGVDRGHIQQPGVLRAMRSVAGQAALRLDRGVLVHEWPAVLHVALGADRILIGRGPDVVVPKGAVNIMAVAALDQAFVHLVVEGHIECRLHIGVALIAERGLGRLEQRLLLAAVNVVAADAADARLGMRSTFEVGMRSRMAAQARGVHLFRRSLGRVEDLGYVAAAVNVRLARAVATLAGDPFLAVQ